VRAAGGSSRVDAALLPADAAQRLEQLPGIARAQAMRSSQLVLSPERPALSLLIRPLQGQQAMQLPWVEGPMHETRPGIAVHISEAVAQLYGLKPGDSWPLLSKAFSLQTQDHQAPELLFT
jgi:putative ABC transport system permease protein